LAAARFCGFDELLRRVAVSIAEDPLTTVGRAPARRSRSSRRCLLGAGEAGGASAGSAADRPSNAAQRPQYHPPVAQPALPSRGPASAATLRSYEPVAEFFDKFAVEADDWKRRNRHYHRLLESIYRFHVLPGARVLEVGCGTGDLLAALRPSVGVGIDVSARMVEEAALRHPDLSFLTVPGEIFESDETFDYIILSDLVPYAHDLLEIFRSLNRASHARTRVIVNAHSQAWRPALRLAERLRLKPAKPMRNWVAPTDVAGLLHLAGFDVVTTTRRILMPKGVPLLEPLLNRVVANIWPFSYLCLSYWLVARLEDQPFAERAPSVTVVCPCRNEQGHIARIIERLPKLGRATELIFVEGGSTDDTRGEIERHLQDREDIEIRLVDQQGKGKGDAVRAGFAAAQHNILVILDGDMSVAPEDLPKFVEALAEGRGEFINGSRLVYDVEPGAMRFLNLLGNKLFGRLLAYALGQHVKDTLCGTKALLRSDYERIAAGRAFFGEFDPFGDFDLLLGAGRLGLRIVDLPVRYQARTYGTTNINRFRDGLLLFRMTAFAFNRFKMRIYRT
jgi:ubiquinone/menaquinone biosynthesis C-methylase UbiE